MKTNIWTNNEIKYSSTIKTWIKQFLYVNCKAMFGVWILIFNHCSLIFQQFFLQRVLNIKSKQEAQSRINTNQKSPYLISNVWNKTNSCRQTYIFHGLSSSCIVQTEYVIQHIIASLWGWYQMEHLQTEKNYSVHSKCIRMRAEIR
jgi:hypothetical protein